MPVSAEIAQIKTAVARRFTSVIAAGNLNITGGVYNCRPMRPQPHNMPDGILAYSEHSWGNAWDLYYGDRPRRYVDKVVAWLKEEDAAGRLPVGSIITYGPSGNHVHIEGAPKRNPRPYTSIPPCAEPSPTPPPEAPDMLAQITDATWTAFYDHGHIDGKPEDMPHYYFNSTTTTKDSERWHALNIALQSMALKSAQQSPAGIGSGDQVTISGTITT